MTANETNNAKGETMASTVPTEVKKLINKSVADGNGYMWGSMIALQFLAKDHPRFAEMTASLPVQARETVGCLVIEAKKKQSDALSFPGGFFFKTNDTHVAKTKVLWVLAKEDGSADVEHLTRDGGALASWIK